MNTMTIGGYLQLILDGGTASIPLRQAAKSWLDTDRTFTRWIHETAKKEGNEEGMLALVESEGTMTEKANLAWKAYQTDKIQLSESALIEVLEEMTLYRQLTMQKSPNR